MPRDLVKGKVGNFMKISVAYDASYGRRGGWVVETENHNPDNDGVGRDDFWGDTLQEALDDFMGYYGVDSYEIVGD